MVERLCFLIVYARQVESNILNGHLTDVQTEKACGRLIALTNAMRGCANIVGYERPDEIEQLYPKRIVG